MSEKHPMTLIEEVRALAASWEREASSVRKSASYRSGDARNREYESTLRHHAEQLREIVGRPGQ